MSDLTLTRSRLQAGRWEGVLKAPAEATPPPIEAVFAGAPLPGLEIAPIAERPGRWAVGFPLPLEMLSEGVQTILIRAEGGQTLDTLSIVSGVPLEEDIRAEIDFLRAEVEMLKAALRRHLRDSEG